MPPTGGNKEKTRNLKTNLKINKMKLELPTLARAFPIFHGMPPTSGSKITKQQELKREEIKGKLRKKEQVGNVTRNQTKEKLKNERD